MRSLFVFFSVLLLCGLSYGESVSAELDADINKRLQVQYVSQGVDDGRILVYKVKGVVREVTLMYTSTSGDASCALTNNLDLYVKLPTGEILESTSISSTFEQIVLPYAMRGVRVYVKASRVPVGKQPFFLIAR